MEKFWDLKIIRMPQDIFKLNYEKISNLDGWGNLSTSNLQYSIEQSKEISLDKFIYSLGIRHIGIENAKLIAENSKSISNFLDIINKKDFQEFLNIDGIGETQVDSIKKFFKKKINYDVVFELNKILLIQDKKINKKGKLKNKTFMFTGKLSNISRAEAKSLVEKNSGSVLSTVNKKLNYLVIGKKPINKKIEQAKKIGIEIISQSDLNKLLN